MTYDILEYVDDQGRSPFQAWFDTMDVLAATKIQTAIRRMELGNLGDIKAVGDGVLERRIDWGPGLRIYFAKDGETLLLLLCGGTKRRQQKDIEAASRHWADYRRRKIGTST